MDVMDGVRMKGIRVGILGPAGTFSEIAALKWAESRGERVEMRYYDTILDVSDGLLSEEVDYGIVPIENSLEGSVGETLDALSGENGNPGAGASPGADAGSGMVKQTQMQIVGEILVPIRICLLAQSYDFDRIKRVVSHPHALAQCKRFLRERCKGKEVKPVDSTAVAAKQASQSEEIAALASEAAAREYHLKIIEENVQDMDSVTRFVVLSSASSNLYTSPSPTGRDKTSILIYLKDRPGALYDVLGEFAMRGINLTKIESRPSKRAMGDYMFHIDCEGHKEDRAIRDALAGVKKRVAMLKILGSYPMAEELR